MAVSSNDYRNRNDRDEMKYDRNVGMLSSCPDLKGMFMLRESAQLIFLSILSRRCQIRLTPACMHVQTLDDDTSSASLQL